MKIDAFTHIFPKPYWERMVRALPDGRDMHKRVRAIPSIVDLEVRFRIMDEFGDDYRQVLTIGSPPIEGPASTAAWCSCNPVWPTSSAVPAVSSHR